MSLQPASAHASKPPEPKGADEKMADSDPGSGSSPPVPTLLQKSLSVLGMTRSNSVGPDGKPLTHRGRRDVRPPDPSKAAASGEPKAVVPTWPEASVIAVFSREARANFARNWRATMKDDPAQRARGLKGPPTEQEKALLERVGTAEVDAADISGQVKALLQNKSAPHVIVIIEGESPDGDVSFEHEFAPGGDSVGGDPGASSGKATFTYTRALTIKGKNVLGSPDKKQNFTGYVRTDLVGVYALSAITVDRGGEGIPCVAVDYSDVEGRRYRALAVHLPNKFVGTEAQNQDTHQAFVAYGEKLAKDATPPEKPRILTGYFGDTNFVPARHEPGVPSIGGRRPDGSTLTARGSAAQADTAFMQDVPLAASDVQAEQGFQVVQPSALNYVFIPGSGIATDHPSFLKYTLHQASLEGRDPAAFPAYYRPVGGSPGGPPASPSPIDTAPHPRPAPASPSTPHDVSTAQSPPADPSAPVAKRPRATVGASAHIDGSAPGADPLLD